MSNAGPGEAGEENEKSIAPRRRSRLVSPERDPMPVPNAPVHSMFTFGFHEDKNALKRRKMEVGQPVL